MSELELTWTGRALDLEWTDEPPEEEGWYWLDDNEAPSKSPRIVEVVPSHADEDAEIQFLVHDPIDGPGISRAFKDYQNARWAGPIPRPSSSQDQ
jgi:hypothetical protein